MVAYGERQRVRRLLAEAITMLCKSSLSYKFGFSVEGLLGITLDDNQVILVNINEEVSDRSWDNDTRTKVPYSPRDDPIDLRVSLDLQESAKNVHRDSATATTPSEVPNNDSTAAGVVKARNKEFVGLDQRGKREMSRARLSNGHGSKKRRQLETSLQTPIKQEFEESQDVKVPVPIVDNLPISSSATPDPISSCQDIIFIQDGESDSDTSVEGEPSPPNQPNETPPRLPLEKMPHSEVAQSSIKVENTDSAPSSPRATGQSPVEITYEAGMWAAEAGSDLPNSSQSLAQNQVPQVVLTNSSNSGNSEQEIVVPSVQQAEVDHTEWPTDPQRRPRASYSTAYKLMVVRRAIESGNMRATARKFGIHFKQVWQWTRNKDKLLAMSLSALRSPRLWPHAACAINSNGTRESQPTDAVDPKESSPD